MSPLFLSQRIAAIVRVTTYLKREDSSIRLNQAERSLLPSAKAYLGLLLSQYLLIAKRASRETLS